MSIKFKLALGINALLLVTVLMYGLIVYRSEKALHQRQTREARESALKSLASVAAESLPSGDEQLLNSYISDLKRFSKELSSAYVTDGRYIIAHTDRKLAPRQLPLSSPGEQVRTHSSQLMVRKAFRPEKKEKGVTYSRRRVVVKGEAYDVVVGFSEAKAAEIEARALSSVLTSLFEAGALSLVAGTLLAFLISWRMTSPIRTLVKAFAATGAGDLTRRLEDTERRDEIGTLNREFNRMVASLRELDDMKKDFVSSVTHELKSPLGAIESYLDLMSYEVAQGAREPSAWAAKLPKFLENIAFVKQNSERLLRFIGDLLDAAKIEKGKFEVNRRPARIEPLIQNVVQLFGERARAAGIELRAELPAGLPEALLDPERMTQVLTNLVSNAVKYTPAGGKVTVTALVVREGAGRAAAAGRQPDVTERRALRVAVEDTGPGIPKEAIGRLFGKFYQVPGSRNSAIGPKGTGLGLFIVRNIVEAHGGRAFAENCGKGSRFGFELPA